jgi:hypothetical protein
MKSVLTILSVLIALVGFSVVMIAMLGPALGGSSLFFGAIVALWCFLRDREKERKDRDFWFAGYR